MNHKKTLGCSNIHAQSRSSPGRNSAPNIKGGKEPLHRATSAPATNQNRKSVVEARVNRSGGRGTGQMGKFPPSPFLLLVFIPPVPTIRNNRPQNLSCQADDIEDP